ncbi:hypothetical protein D3C73_1104870 [compost metagenome]
MISFNALERAHREAKHDYEREHVCPYIYENPDKFSVQSYQPLMRNYSHYRLTLDTPEDLKLINKVYEHLYRENCIFTLENVLELMLNEPWIHLINSHIEQKKQDV